MADISDEQIRSELELLTGKNVGPVTHATRSLMIKKLLKLREENKLQSSDSNITSQSKRGSSHQDQLQDERDVHVGTGTQYEADVQVKSKEKASRAKSLVTSSFKSKVSSAGPKSKSKAFGFSSDEDQDENNGEMDVVTSTSGSAASNVSRSKAKRKVISTNSVKSTVKATTKQSAKLKDKPSGAPTDRLNGHEPGDNVNTSKFTEDEIMLLSIDEIREKLYELTGDRYPITDSNKMLHARKLCKLLKSSRVADSVHNATAMEVSMPTETQFSDSDEEQMDFEPSHVVTTGDSFTPVSITNRPQLVSQAVNTSSFLDVTTPGVADADPDCFVLPSCSIQSDSTDDDIQISSNSPNFAEIPSRLSSPNLSSTRRSFVPPAPVTTSGTFFRKPLPPSPPRSVYARRPLRDNKFIPFNTEGSPRPINRFRSTASAGDAPTRPDYATRFNTDGGRVLSEPRSKTAKVAKDVDMMIRDRGKSPSYVYSRALVIGLAMFLLTVLSYYAFLRMTAPLPLEQVFQSQDVYWPLIEKGDGAPLGDCHPAHGQTCYSAEEIRAAKVIADHLRVYLAEHAGRHECKWPEYTQGKVAVSVARHDMNIAHGKKVQHLWKPVLELLFWNPLWKVRLASINQTSVKSAAEVAFLESEETARPLSCVILNAMTSILTAVVAAFALAILGYLAYTYGRYRKQKMKEVDDLFYDLLENTIDMLESQLALSKDNPDEKPYLAISHVHDTLINPPDRNAMRGVWARVVRHMKENESRVREELQQVQGEEYLVWRWLQSTDPKTSPGSGRSRWLGTALRDAMTQKLNFTPKHCLKIRGMFDRRKVVGTEWVLRIQDDILERLEPDHGVVHIAIGDELNENCVYIKLASRKHAGRAFQLLNGSYYEATGDCVQCKFMESSKYHQKFPHAEFTKVQVKKSTEQTLHSPRIYPSLS